MKIELIQHRAIRYRLRKARQERISAADCRKRTQLKRKFLMMQRRVLRMIANKKW